MSTTEDTSQQRTDWHRLFGLAVTDLFTGTSYRVELEKDLSVKRQFVDVIIIEQAEGDQPEELPDGLGDLAAHNLLTYKSLREPLDEWALDELIGHYVNYRKQISPSGDDLLPVDEFRLYAVCTRYPQKLSGEITLHRIQDGVYDVQWGLRLIRVIVLNQIPPTPKNALWDLFSGIQNKVRYGASHYRWRMPDHSTFVYTLYELYSLEETFMAYTWDDFYHDFTRDHVDKLTLKERLQGLSLSDILKWFVNDETLQERSAEKLAIKAQQQDTARRMLAEGFDAAMIAKISGLTADEIAALADEQT